MLFLPMRCKNVAYCRCINHDFPSPTGAGNCRIACGFDSHRFHQYIVLNRIFKNIVLSLVGVFLGLFGLQNDNIMTAFLFSFNEADSIPAALPLQTTPERRRRRKY